MLYARALFNLTLLFCTAICWGAQAPANGNPAQTPSVGTPPQQPANATPAPTAPAAPTAISAILQPALNTVKQAVSAVKLDKWKKGTVRQEAGADIDDILRDLETTLPPQLSAVDATPDTLSKVLPVFRNIDALYDVLLRVVQASRVSGTPDQVTQLEQSLVSLGNARRTLAQHLLDAATAQEKQISDLRAALQAESAQKAPVKPAPAAAAPCAAPAPAKKPRKKRTPPATTTPKPSTAPAPATGSGTAPAKPGQ